MTERAEDTAGTVVGFLAGVAVGAALAVPAIPPGSLTLRFGSLTLDTVDTVLLVSALSILLLPLGLFSLHQLFSLADR
jgi:hypothetical protein